jgi:hypothetical protein
VRPAASTLTTVRPAARWAAPIVVVVLGIATLFAIEQLQSRADTSRDAQLTLAHVENELNVLQSAPFQASVSSGGSPARARNMIDRGSGGFGFRSTSCAVMLPPRHSRPSTAPSVPTTG